MLAILTLKNLFGVKQSRSAKPACLETAGFDMTLDGKDSFSVQYQNANNSVRVTDEFMEAVEKGEKWNLRAVTNGKTVETVEARDIFRKFPKLHGNVPILVCSLILQLINGTRLQLPAA
jgi:ribonucleoside-diphosphate reductase alpha chain